MAKKKTAKKMWARGRKRFTDQEIVPICIKVSAEQHDWLRRQENISATIRALIDRERQRAPIQIVSFPSTEEELLAANIAGR